MSITRVELYDKIRQNDEWQEGKDKRKWENV